MNLVKNRWNTSIALHGAWDITVIKHGKNKKKVVAKKFHSTYAAAKA